MTIYNAMLRFGSEKIKHGSGFRSEFEPNRTEPNRTSKGLQVVEKNGFDSKF